MLENAVVKSLDDHADVCMASTLFADMHACLHAYVLYTYMHMFYIATRGLGHGTHNFLAPTMHRAHLCRKLHMLYLKPIFTRICHNVLMLNNTI